MENVIIVLIGAILVLSILVIKRGFRITYLKKELRHQKALVSTLRYRLGDKQSEECEKAAEFYLAIFDSSKRIHPMPTGLGEKTTNKMPKYDNPPPPPKKSKVKKDQERQ